MAAFKREEVASTELNIHDVHTILGPESSFEGKLIFEGTVRIDGNFTGEIQTDGILVIGQSAKVQAQITVGNIVINGEVTGDVVARSLVEIHAPAKVRGNITTPQLMISKGVIFEGSSNMEALHATEQAAQSAHIKPYAVPDQDRS